MSVVVHIFESPAATTGKQAQELIDSGAMDAGPGCEKFPAFTQELRERYPDAETLEGRGESGEDSAWADSPLESDGAQSLLTLGLLLSNTDEDFWPFVVNTAADHGLHVFDPQSGALWRPDRREVDFNGVEKRFPLPPPTWGRKKRAAPPPVDRVQILKLVMERLIHHLGKDGWNDTHFHDWGGADRGCIARQRGEVRQIIALNASNSDRTTVHLSVHFGFSSDDLHRELRELLPEASHLEEIRTKKGPYNGDLRDGFYEFFGPRAQDELALRSSGIEFTSKADALAWADRFARWWERIGILFDSCDRPETLNRLVHSKWRLSRALFATNMHDLLYELMLLDAGWPAPSADFDAWLAVARAQWEKECGGLMKMTQAQLEERGEGARWQVTQARHVATLMERLLARRATP